MDGAPKAESGDPRAGEVPEELAGESEALSSLLLALASAPERDVSELAPRLEPGAVVGRFELLRELGRGGFGVVFEARDRELNRLVAFKALRRATRGGTELDKPLREEAEAAARLNHANVVTLHDFGVFEGTPYLILELLRGETLQDRLKRGPMTPAEALAVALDLARGLVHAHAMGVLHRDLKPGNVFLCEPSAGPPSRCCAKILDFGLARLTGRAGLAGGTAAYMAPEQLRGEAGDARTDVFSAAVVFFQMLSGELPFPPRDGKSAVLDPGPPPQLPLPDAPPELAALLASALSKDPADRPQGAQALLDALVGVERAYAERAAVEVRAARRRRLRRIAAGVGAAALAAASVAAALALRSSAAAEKALRASRIASAAEGASDPLAAALLMAELPDDPPPRAVEIANRILREPIPVATFEGTKGGFGLAASPDGTRIAAGTQGGGVSVWRVDGTGAPVVLNSGGNRTNGIAWTRDGGRIVAIGHDGDLRVFPSDGGARPVVVHVTELPLLQLRLDPASRVAAVSGHEGKLWLVDLDLRRPPRALAAHGGPVLSIAFSPDGTRIATGAGDGFLRVFEVASGRAVLQVPLPGGALFDLAWPPTGKAIAVASEDGFARLVTPRGEIVDRTGAPGFALGMIAFDETGERIVTASADGVARVHVLGDAARDVRLRGHRGPILGARFLPGGKRVLTNGADGTARLWSDDGEAPPVVLRGSWAYEAAISPDGTRVFTRGEDGTIRVWRTEDPRDRGVIRLAAGSVGGSAGWTGSLGGIAGWTRDGQRLLVTSHDGTAVLWPVHGGERLVIRDPSRATLAAALDPADAHIATGADDGVVRIWDARTGALLRELRGHDGPVEAVAFNPDGELLASAALDRTVRIWRADGTGAPRVLAGHAGGVTSVAWMPDGKAVVSSSGLDATVRVWPIAGGPPRVIEANAAVWETSVTPRGTVLIPEEGGLLRLFWPDGRCDATFQALPDGLVTAAPSPDGSRVALASINGTVWIHRLDGQGVPLVLRTQDAAVKRAAFSPDVTELATATEDGTAQIFTIDWPKLRDQLRASTTACLPLEYRRQALGESRLEAEQRLADCHRAHGRMPPVAAPTPGPPPPSAAAGGEKKAVKG